MKRRISLALLTLLFVPTIASAEPVSFKWEMDEQPTDLVGYKIYHVGKPDPIFTINDPSARTFKGEYTMGDGKECFFITAFDSSSDSVPSNHSCKDTLPPGVSVFEML